MRSRQKRGPPPLTPDRLARQHERDGWVPSIQGSSAPDDRQRRGPVAGHAGSSAAKRHAWHRRQRTACSEDAAVGARTGQRQWIGDRPSVRTRKIQKASRFLGVHYWSGDSPISPHGGQLCEVHAMRRRSPGSPLPPPQQHAIAANAASGDARHATTRNSPDKSERSSDIARSDAPRTFIRPVLPA